MSGQDCQISATTQCVGTALRLLYNRLHFLGTKTRVRTRGEVLRQWQISESLLEIFVHRLQLLRFGEQLALGPSDTDLLMPTLRCNSLNYRIDSMIVVSIGGVLGFQDFILDPLTPSIPAAASQSSPGTVKRSIALPGFDHLAEASVVTYFWSPTHSSVLLPQVSNAPYHSFSRTKPLSDLTFGRDVFTTYPQKIQIKDIGMQGSYGLCDLLPDFLPES